MDVKSITLKNCRKIITLLDGRKFLSYDDIDGHEKFYIDGKSYELNVIKFELKESLFQPKIKEVTNG